MDIKKYMENNNIKYFINSDWVSYRLNKIGKKVYLDWIDLKPLPKKMWNGNLAIDWKNSKNIQLKCSYKNELHYFDVVKPIYNYKPKVELLYILVNVNNENKKINRGNIKNCVLYFIDDMFSKHHKYDIGNIVSDCEVLDKIVIKSKYRKNSNSLGYLLKCTFTNKIFEWSENNLNKSNTSPYYNRLTVNDYNCLWNKRPDLRPYIKDEKYAKTGTTPFSRTNNITLKCPNCGKEKIYKVKNLPKLYNCYSCSDNTPFTEKLFEAILMSNNVNYETQKVFDDCKTTIPLPFDFYLKDLNILVEIMGIQHYEEKTGFSNTESLKSIQKRDKIKSNFCDKNNIKLIYIDTRKSNYDYIINSVKKTELCNLLDLSINKEIRSYLLVLNEKHRYPINKIIDLVDSGYNYKDTTKILNEQGYKISRYTVSRKYNNFKKRD